MGRTLNSRNTDVGQCPDKSLWCAVVLQALNDATSACGDPRDRQQAIRWFTKPNADFRKVCALAGIDPEATRERAVEAIATAEKALAANTAAHGDGMPPPRGRIIEHEGLTLTMRQWSERKGISIGAISFRLAKGWSAQDALDTPLHKNKSGPRRPRGGSNTLSAA